MFQLPPMPTWDSLHPLIIHFPVALLFAAPIFVFLGAALGPRRGRAMLYSALLLMALGSLSIFVAVQTGEAAGKLAERTPQVNAIIEDHEELAETTRITFSILTAVFAGIVLFPVVSKRIPGRIASTVLPLLFLVAYSVGMVVLANTADHGGRLVHELGVHALVAPDPSHAQIGSSGQ